MQPTPSASPGVAKGKGSQAGGESPGLHKRTARKVGETGLGGATRRFTLDRREGLAP